MLIFDIETCPNVTVEDCPPFDQDTVKLGNLKDPDKIAIKLQEARARHTEIWMEEAPLCSTRGRILTLQMYSLTTRKVSILDATDPVQEPELITKFWLTFDRMQRDGRQMAGVNIYNFDLPFFIRRSWILDVPVPVDVRTGRYWSPVFIDLSEHYLCGQRWGDEVSASFDSLAKAFGTAGKPHGIKGDRFYREWFDGDRAKCLDYMREDVLQPAEWVVRMGLWKE